MTATVVFLNGVGSAGKTSIARALQAIARTPFIHVGVDRFLDMLPARAVGTEEGIVFAPRTRDGRPAIEVVMGPAGARLMTGMRHAIAALAEQGNHLIVDEVLVGPGPAADEYRRLLAPFRTIAIGVHAPLDVLEARERARGDRAIGLARWQIDRVHGAIPYDLEIDTTRMTAADAAALICRTFDL